RRAADSDLLEQPARVVRRLTHRWRRVRHPPSFPIRSVGKREDLIVRRLNAGFDLAWIVVAGPRHLVADRRVRSAGLSLAEDLPRRIVSEIEIRRRGAGIRERRIVEPISTV